MPLVWDEKIKAAIFLNRWEYFEAQKAFPERFLLMEPNVFQKVIMDLVLENTKLKTKLHNKR